MEKYDVIVLGFGKAGKTLAAKLSMIGKKVAIVEENTTMYGGTCINIGCIPTKTLLVAVEKGMDFEIRDVDLFNKPEDISIMNPYGQVPILVERDLILYKNLPIRIHNRYIFWLIK